MKGTGWGWSSSDTQGRYNTARKDYICDHCGCPIPKGTYYAASRSAFAYKTRTYHYHFMVSECEKAKAEALKSKERPEDPLEGNAESVRPAQAEEPSH